MIAVIVEFFTTKLGKGLLIVGALVAWTLYQRDQGYNKGRLECQDTQLKATITEITRQRDQVQAALDDAGKQQAATENEMAALEKERDTLKSESKVQSGNPCKFPDNALKRLRNIK